MVIVWGGRLLMALVTALAAVYLGDWGVFQLRGEPQSQVVVSQFLATPLKGNKTEYDYAGTGPVNCAAALFPRDNLSPCWYLKRHPKQFE